MNRFHEKVYFPDNARQKLKVFTDRLNSIDNWSYSRHSIDNLKYRVNNIKGILVYLKNLKLNSEQVFEYYEDITGIKKAVYKIDFQGIYDLCLVISDVKNIITIYINSKGDNHSTLNKGLYVSN